MYLWSMKEQRYIVTIEAYIYAESDEDAKSKAIEIVDMLPEDSSPGIESIICNPFGSFKFRQIQ